MRTLIACLLSVAPVMALDWSDPVPFYNDTFTLHGPSCCVGPGETLWTAYTAGRHTALTDKYQVQMKWSARGESWSDPIAVTEWDSTQLYSDPGIGCDAQGRLWVSWYCGEYPAAGCGNPQNSAIWTVMRDSAGLHEPVKAFQGFAYRKQNFSHDPEGNWYLGFEEQTPFTDRVYSSAMYVRLLGDTWSDPHAISRGCGEPIHTNMYLPELVPRSDRGIWSVNGMNVVGTSDHVGLLKSVRNDTVSMQAAFDGHRFVAALDSTGHLWVVYFMMPGYRMLASVELENGVPLDTQLIYALGGNDPFICADTFGAVWVLWTRYGDQIPVVSWSDGHGWSSPERAGSGDGPAKGLLPVDRCGGIIVLFQSADWHYYSVVGEPRPGVAERTGMRAEGGRMSQTVVRGSLVLPWTLEPWTPWTLVSITGRKVMDLQPGNNDIWHVAPGVYFIRRPETEDGRPRAAVRKVVIQR